MKVLFIGHGKKVSYSSTYIFVTCWKKSQTDTKYSAEVNIFPDYTQKMSKNATKKVIFTKNSVQDGPKKHFLFVPIYMKPKYQVCPQMTYYERNETYFDGNFLTNQPLSSFKLLNFQVSNFKFQTFKFHG